MCDKETLKTCPFCGERAYLIEDYDGWYSVSCSNIYCPRDLYIGKFTKKDVAINVWNTWCTWIENSERNYDRIAEHNRQLIDDIEKADSDYFKMKENRDEWKDAFHKSVEEFKKLSKICDTLITAREMLTEEVNDLKDELKSMDYDFMDSREGYENDIDSLEDENEKLKNALESTEKELNDYQETCETLTKDCENLTRKNKDLKSLQEFADYFADYYAHKCDLLKEKNEVLHKENERLKNLCKLCGSY